MGLLEGWLGAPERARFLRQDLGKRSFARPDVLSASERAFDWPMLIAALRCEANDTLVVAGDQLLTTPQPTTLSALRSLLSRGVGVAVRDADRSSAHVASLCDALAQDIDGQQRAIIFATPAGKHGFGWHFDEEEVFVLQTAGEKTYYFRPNTVSPRPLFACPAAFEAIRDEKAPVYACRLHAGDCLYLPSGYWHCAHAHSDSLSISLGVLTDANERG